jgi:hypothetical protein
MQAQSNSIRSVRSDGLILPGRRLIAQWVILFMEEYSRFQAPAKWLIGGNCVFFARLHVTIGVA